MVEFKKVRQGLTWVERDQFQEDVADERQIKRSAGFSMAVPISLPVARVAFVVVAVFQRPVPVPARRLGRKLLYVNSEAPDKVAEVFSLVPTRQSPPSFRKIILVVGDERNG
jgi:hypothetical protein